MSPFWILLELMVMEILVSGDNWSYNMCKVPVKLASPTNGLPLLLSSQQCQSTRVKNPWTWSPQAHLDVFQPWLFPSKAPDYLGGGLPSVSSALWCQYPIYRPTTTFHTVN